ncbi:MAG: AraC family transcriptional regulator, partial [Chitinophagaceae bacterium]
MLRCNYLNDTIPSAASTFHVGTRVTFSSLMNYEMAEYSANTYSIKYVLQGTEHYVLNRQKFSVSRGNYLLVNRQQAVDAVVRSTKKVLGFCIHLEEELLQESFAQLQFSETALLDHPFEKPAIPQFENLLYRDEENALGCYLQQTVRIFKTDSASIAIEPTAFYLELSQHLLATQNNLPKTAQRLDLVKNSTKQELLRRLQTAKELLDAQQMEDVNINLLAQKCALSGSHLFRSFKKVYGVSPYQYLLQQKLKKAACLLQKKEETITDAALLCGFTDLPSFS